MSNPTGKGGKRFDKDRQPKKRGRPLGSRHKLQEVFLEALCADFVKHGASALTALREIKPEKYAEIIAGLLPKQVDVKSDSTVTHVSESVSETARWLDESLREQADRAATHPLPN